MFLKNKNIIFKIRRSKVTDYAALILSVSMVVLIGFNAFGTRLQSLWIMFFARKDFPCGVRNRMQDKILFRQLRFSLFSSARYFDICLCRFLSEDF